MAEIACPACSETEKLRGERVDDDIRLTCERCRHTWIRDMARRCPTCNSTDVVAAPKAMVEKVRGDQMSLVGTYAIYLCRTCDKKVLDAHIQSGAPVPPDVLPVESRRA